MPRFTIQRGFDARCYYSAVIEAKTIEEAAAIAYEDYYDMPDRIKWKEDGFDSFDNMETVNVIDEETGKTLSWHDGGGWEEDCADETYTDLTERLDEMDMDEMRRKVVAVQVQSHEFTVVFECFDGAQSDLYMRQVTAENKNEAIGKAFQAAADDFGWSHHDGDIDNLITDNVIVFDGHIDAI